MGYRGRFAPSATGPLHLGSLFTALVSRLRAKAQGGQWLVRIDDLDTFRCRESYVTSICDTLDAFGLIPDEPLIRQRARQARYEDALAGLKTAGRVYHCTCSRKQRTSARYPGTCRCNLGQALDPQLAWRVDTAGLDTGFADLFQGAVSPDPPGDFVIKRRDGLIAYHLACAVDEATDGITEVIRGIDLLESTPGQRFLAKLLGHTAPSYGHIPVLVDATGAKLSKQTFATPIDSRRPGAAYHRLARLTRRPDPPDASATPKVWIDYFASFGDPVRWLPTCKTILVHPETQSEPDEAAS